MKYRIAMWASAGFVVAVFWAVYFARVSRDIPINPTAYALARFSCPIALLGDYFHLGVKLSPVLVTNVAFYALFGVIVEALRRQFGHAS